MRAHDKEPTLNLASLWSLDPSVTYLNHGSFGACPAAVLAAQAALRLEMEREPVDFLVAKLPGRLNAARQTLAEFSARRPTIWCSWRMQRPASTRCCARSRSSPGDELLMTNHTYAACRKTIDFVASRTGARVVVAALPFPCRDDEEVVAAVLSAPHRARASRCSIMSPARRLSSCRSRAWSANCATRGIETLRGRRARSGHGAARTIEIGRRVLHRQCPQVAVRAEGRRVPARAARPAGAAAPHRDQPRLHSAASTRNSTGPEPSIRRRGCASPRPCASWAACCPGGWPELMARNRALALQARDFLCTDFGLEAPAPDAMIGSMASIPLPAAEIRSPAARLDSDALCDWFRERGVEPGSIRIPCRCCASRRSSTTISISIGGSRSSLRRLCMADERSGIEARLSTFDTAMVVFSLVVGIGIFRTPSIVAGAAGSTSLFFAAWMIGGLVSLIGALTFAEIGSRHPRAGGYLPRGRGLLPPGAGVHAELGADAHAGRGRRGRRLHRRRLPGADLLPAALRVPRTPRSCWPARPC